MLQSVHVGDDADLVAAILDMHSPGPRVLDMTYGHGGFWRHAPSSPRRVVGLDQRMCSGDLDVATTHDIESLSLVAGDFTALPFGADSFDAVTFDPPFITSGVMAERYTTFAKPDYEELLRSVAGASREAFRTLSAGGVAVLKAMDWVDGRTVWHWLSDDMTTIWNAAGFRKVDAFVTIRPTSYRKPTIERQSHSKRAHLHFLVFRKPQRKKRTQDLQSAKTPMLSSSSVGGTLA